LLHREPSSQRPPGRWALSKDYAFCERARRAGFAVIAFTTIRLWHVGTYRYGWEDAGSTKEPCAGYRFHLPADTPGGAGPSAHE
jgi:hypothetical protein